MRFQFSIDHGCVAANVDSSISFTGTKDIVQYNKYSCKNVSRMMCCLHCLLLSYCRVHSQHACAIIITVTHLLQMPTSNHIDTFPTFSISDSPNLQAHFPTFTCPVCISQLIVDIHVYMLFEQYVHIESIVSNN